MTAIQHPTQKAALALALALAAGTAGARITTLAVDRVEPFAGGNAFAPGPAYERVIGRAFGELDAADPRNKGIVNLDKAAHTARGRVLLPDDAQAYEARARATKLFDGSASNPQ